MNKEIETWLDQYMENAAPWLKRGRRKGRRIILISVAAALLLCGGGSYAIGQNTGALLVGLAFAAFLTLISVPILLLGFHTAYSSKGMRTHIQGILERTLTTDAEQSLFAAEMSGQEKKIIPYIEERKNERDSYIIITQHFLVLSHSLFFSAIPLEKINKFYLDTEYESWRTTTASSARTTIASYWIKFDMKDPADQKKYPAFLFRENKQAKAAYAALCENLPDYTAQ